MIEMKMMQNAETLKKLKAYFDALHIEVVDNSMQHAGHIAMQGMEGLSGELSGTHLAVLIVSEQFEGQNSVGRHRMVQKALIEEFSDKLHALQIRTMAPSEWKAAG